jgi:choline-sulfatase
VVIIMSDQHNAHIMGCSGNPIVRTPNLDALARRGVRFTSAYCPYPLCAPSRMGFMTGQYPSEIDVWDNDSILSSRIPTFAHALGAAGYRAVLCGRMHFLGHDQFHGFEERIFGDSGGYLSAEIRGAGWNRTNGQTKYAVEVAGHGCTGLQAYDRQVTDRACEFITRYRDKRPYCLVVGYVLPHNPLICSEELFDYYRDALPKPEPVSEAALAALNPAIRMWRERRGVDDLSPEQNHIGLAAYYGLVTEMDQNIGRVMDAITESSDPGNTVAIYCTDHGDMACEHGMWWKSSHYEGSARVPLIFSRPGVWEEDASVEAVVSLIDIGPTVLDVAGAEPLPRVAGRSLSGFLQNAGKRLSWPNEIYCEYIGAHGDAPSCMIRRREWKLMYYSEFDTFLLFNLEEDPQEMHDRAADPECRQVAESLLEKIHTRWSADMMREGAKREREKRAVLDSCGHPLIPHPIAPPVPPPGANSFDFSQGPDWETIRKRLDPLRKA